MLNFDLGPGQTLLARVALAATAHERNVDVFVDLHTTNGSYHGYNLTWAPSLHPGAPLGTYTSDTLLAGVRSRLQQQGTATYAYGNFSNSFAREVTLDTLKDGWFTYDARPRFGSNYFGLTGGVAVLSEAYSHDPFSVRVASTSAFLRELLGTIGRDPSILARIVATRRALAAGVAPRGVVLESRITTRPFRDTLVVEDLAADPDTAGAEPGGAAWHPADRTVPASGHAGPRPLRGRAADIRSPRRLAGRSQRHRRAQPARAPWRDSPEAFVRHAEHRRRAVPDRSREPTRAHLPGASRSPVTGHWIRVRTLPSADWRWIPPQQRQVLVAATALGTPVPKMAPPPGTSSTIACRWRGSTR